MDPFLICKQQHHIRTETLLPISYYVVLFLARHLTLFSRSLVVLVSCMACPFSFCLVSPSFPCLATYCASRRSIIFSNASFISLRACQPERKGEREGVKLQVDQLYAI